MLGEPLGNEQQKPIDFDNEEEFEFKFDIALAPEINSTLTAKDKIDYYTIAVGDTMIDGQVNMYAQRAGKHVKVDSYEAKDMIKGLLAELDEEGNTKEGGIQIEGAVMMPDYMKDEDQKKIFEGAKVNDVLVFNPAKAYEGNDVEISTLLQIKKEEVANITANFSFQIEEITRYVAAEINQELFDQVLGEGVVSSVEEFRAKVKEMIALQFVGDEDYKFLIDVRTAMMAKNEGLQFPDALLKRIMKQNSQDKGDEYVEENYAKSIEELTWHLIKEQLVKAHEVRVEEADIRNMAKEATRAQFAQYGMANVPEDLLEKYAAESLKKREQVDAYVNRCIEMKSAQALKAVVKLNNKEVTVEEFNKLFA